MPRGGMREGAGRRAINGKTQVIRIPERLHSQIQNFIITDGLKLPLYQDPVQAGALADAGSDIQEKVDLTQRIVGGDPAGKFLLNATGDSMIDAGIQDGDLLIVDSSIEPTNGKIVIACMNTQFTVKYFKREKDKMWLIPANDKYKPIPVDKEMKILGVVTGSFRNH